jgi:phosphatidylserine decarboxylase
MSATTDRIFVILQFLLPKYLLTLLVYRVARIRNIAIKDFLIRRFVGFYRINVEELRHPVPAGFPTFNDFFIRELVPAARVVDTSNSSIVSPVDGTVSAAGHLDKDIIFQAKGKDYRLADLLASDTGDAAKYVNGAFATLYLAPHNYHRVHAPVAGQLVAARYVPGALYSVNQATVGNLPRLFARNERLICHFATEFGTMVLIFIGALNVGTINTRWTGDIRPRKHGVVEDIAIRRLGAAVTFAKGETLGWFNMGSTVIILAPTGASDAFAELKSGQTVRMGQRIGQITVST